MVLEKTLESAYYSKKIKPVYPKGNQSWIFIGRTDAETEAPILWPLDAKTLMLGKIEGRRRSGKEDEMVGWHHQLDGHEFEQALGVGDGHIGLACHSPQGCRESDMIEQLN